MEKSTNSEQLHDREYTRRKLNIAAPTLYRYTAQKLIRHVKMGNRIMFTDAMIDEFIAKRTVEPVTAVDGEGGLFW